jgi:sugar phosphate isomerase/epimerase
VIKSAVTISLVPEARGGPFVFWDDLAAACRKTAELGFDGVEVFAPDAEAVDADALGDMVRVAAGGTGAGWLRHKLTLTSDDAEVRQRAIQFVRSIIDAFGPLQAPAIIGSMQGRWDSRVSRDRALGYLAEALNELGDYAQLHHNTVLLFEPLNRYETNLVNTVEDGVQLLRSLSTRNVRLLADLFHMNIEEVDVAAAIRRAGALVGHVHLADSNRRPAGCGHTDFQPIAAALRGIGYDGYVSAEALPFPDPDGAARLTIESFRRYFR